VFTNYQPGANPPMSLLAESVQTTVSGQTRPYLADFNADGQAEIYAGNDVFGFDFSDPAAPVLSLWVSGGAGPNGKRDDPSGLSLLQPVSPVAADLLRPIDCNDDPDCNGLEIAAGYGIYSVDLDPDDGDPMEIKLQKNLNQMVAGPPYSDGNTAVADMDLDGIPDILVNGYHQQQCGVYIWNKNGLLFFYPYENGLPNCQAFSPIAVANVFDDTQMGASRDYPELLVAAYRQLMAVNLNRAAQTPATPYWWKTDTDDISGGNAGAISFDLDGDGQTEIIYRGENSLRILYAGPGPFPPGVDAQRNWATFPAGSATRQEYPVVADVDGDGQAEIVVTGSDQISNFQDLFVGRVKVFEANPANGSVWVGARSVWNQYNYHVVNILDDLSVPRTPQPGHLELPGLGSGKRPLNTVLSQLPLLDKNYEPFRLAPDGWFASASANCSGNVVQINLQVCNQGEVVLPAGTPIRFYPADPTATIAVPLGAPVVLPAALAPDSCMNLQQNFPSTAITEMWAVLNDNGTQAAPFDLNNGYSAYLPPECQYGNNLIKINLPSTGPLPDLGPDIALCENGVQVLQAGAGFLQYRWSTGSTDLTITADAPGLYWVEVLDHCQNLYRDSVLISVDAATSLDLGQDTVLCQGSSLQFQLGGFIGYTWLPTDGLSCADCPNPLAQPATDRRYTLVARTAKGCYSVDSIFIRIAQPVSVEWDTVLCSNDTLLWFGEAIPAGAVREFYFTTVWGCDSVVTIRVGALPVFQSMESRTICTGDSSLIFGQWQTVAGIYPLTYLAANGCDSVHTVNLAVLPVFETDETRAICAGDSSLIGGLWQSTAGAYQRTFSAANGCDSVHTVDLSVLPVFETAEMRTICSGDSSQIFGLWQSTAGTYQRTFSGVNGCDSVHTVDLAVLPVFETEETRAICAGDSSLIFGLWQKSAGTYQHTFSAANGCDSVHTVKLSVLPVFETEETRVICAGDSSLIFGLWQKSAGTYQHTFSAANGCDSVHTVVLSVLPIFETEEMRAVCAGDSSLIFGLWQKSAGTYQ
ncbi:MAG: VCBS repeat-containing protein, partial [Saprospiraceae bacterium]|nr:VCBS repeat-containing protein [Saprospiraceae bacterium]